MKSVELFCASPASTAICSSTDQRSMVRHGGIRPTDRHGHRLGDHHHRHKTRTPIPCSSHPISPRPYCDKNRKDTSSSSPQLSLEYLHRKSSADISGISRPPPNRSSKDLLSDTPLLDLISNSEHSSSALVPSQHVNVRSARHHSFNGYPGFRSSVSSSTYSYDNPVYEFSSFRSNDDFHAYRSSFFSRSNDDFHTKKSSVSRSNDDFYAYRSSFLSRSNDDCQAQKSSVSRLINDDVHAQKSSSSRSNTSHASKSSIAGSNDSQACTSPSTRGRPHHQIVELRVSIHCKGCEGKIRKHISRMEGVTSYSIDLETKKVTVIGNVTPLGVLTSISKVKNAEFWTSPISSSSSSSPTVGMSLVST